MAAGARAALRALLALLCCGAPCAVGGVALRPRAGPGDVKVPRVRLPGGGGAMPMAGLGLPKCEPDAAVGGDCREKARNATLEFLLLGGRLLDTALAYENHRAVGAAIREAVDRHGVRREDLRWAAGIRPSVGHHVARDAVPLRLLRGAPVPERQVSDLAPTAQASPPPSTIMPSSAGSDAAARLRPRRTPRPPSRPSPCGQGVLDSQ
ncbi:unnamed protein product [Prorocentrum cordatum]|uniref:NADP-dependent oxidoreductase domain-containing protein n=1 Tax=Prorocentrum cordatum TaxID=2364126 RepID=A0ABN9Q8H6_9DINO|nr:unnamed protein product [Polarella glacialis]